MAALKRILASALTFVLFLILVPITGMSAMLPDSGYESEYATGLIWDSPEVIEANLREYPATAYESVLPSTVDLESVFPLPGNQGIQNSCVPWAIAYALKSHQEEAKQG